MVKAAPSAAFVVAEPYFLLEFEIVAFDPPAPPGVVWGFDCQGVLQRGFSCSVVGGHVCTILGGPLGPDLSVCKLVSGGT